ncbi:MAG TPA: two-component regulator propeller domain-containing protein, partial [Gemmatimonadaceae bacterium]|nr:two-component regulator propeller domain-containing protein [Gemmatimonadaceae bacterium]
MHVPSACWPRRRALVASAVAVVLTCVAPLRLHGQGTLQASHHAVATWGTEQGLPSSIVLGIQQTGDGYLWLATYEGLVRFDGVRFRTFASADIPGLWRGSFVALAVDPAGALWAGSESGELVRRLDGRWTVFDTDDGLPPDRITALELDRAGGLWVGSRIGVWRMADGRAVPLAAPAGRPAPGVVALAQSPDGALWIGTVSDGILRYEDGRYTSLTTHDGLPSDQVDALHADEDGTLWVGFYGGSGVTRIRDGVVTHLGAGGADAPRRVRDFLRDRAGTLWLAAENGLFTLRGDRVEAVPLAADGTIKVEALFEDAEGNVWAGSRQGGLFRVRDATFRVLSTGDGLPHPFAFAVAGDGRGGVWIATREGVVHQPVRGSAAGTARYGPQDGILPEHAVRDLMRDDAGDVWIATTGGLTRLPGGDASRAVTYTSRDGMSDDRARTLAAGRGGAVWVGTFDGVTEWRDGRLRAYGQADGLTDGYVLSVFEDSRGTLWVGTQTAGLFHREPGGRFHPGPAALTRQPIFRITEDGDGTLWIGTGRGLARLVGRGQAARVALVSTHEGLPGNTVFQALDDGRGALWLTGPWGIARAPLDGLRAVADGRAATASVRPFGRGDGLVVREGSSIGRSWRAPDGTLWFPTPAGVAVVDPARLRAVSASPVARVDEVVVDGVVSALDAGQPARVTLRPGTRTLELHFTAPSFVAPEQLQFRYRLEGFDDGWRHAGTDRVAHYTRLSPATYRLVVQARAADAEWPDGDLTDTAAPALIIEMRARVWQTWWFLALMALGAGSVAALAYRLRTRSLTRASARVAREEVLRAMSLRDEMTGLYNRRGLLTLAEQQARAAARERRGFVLLFADLDGLKWINDTLGHAAGDGAIVDAATLLRETFREADIIARLGGDEVVVLLPASSGATTAGDGAASDAGATAAAACERLLGAVARHNDTVARPYRLSLSLGTSSYDPAAPRPFEE